MSRLPAHSEVSLNSDRGKCKEGAKPGGGGKKSVEVRVEIGQANEDYLFLVLGKQDRGCHASLEPDKDSAGDGQQRAENVEGDTRHSQTIINLRCIGTATRKSKHYGPQTSTERAGNVPVIAGMHKLMLLDHVQLTMVYFHNMLTSFKSCAIMADPYFP